MDTNDDGRLDIYEFVDAIEPKFELESHNMKQLHKVFNEPDDPVTIYKDKTKTTQKFYNNNFGVSNPGELFK